ncbi:polysaccharide deacetylase family protein [Lederbergia lenta]|uniref:polysaccharide deacetylase family protein n=1 Tax=Lederbergia lenta TaxID=1467 RepID=UPI00203AE926|nr:polysaccharide deacetylase family protein [Lederbergia lenta]MCM3110104.1 polysaccharide deacetylase family protein [Lederbergia lenta]
MRHTKNLLGIGMVGILLLLVIYNPYTGTYLSSLKNNEIYVSAKYDELYEEIEQAAEKYYIPPQNAKIDSVWKATPGYNGMEVDVKSSFKIMKKDKQFDKRKLVFVQITPDVHLEDLPPSPIFRGHPDKPMVSFLINVAWGNEYLPDMLETLEKNNVQATFFLEGRWVKKNPDLTKLIVDNGHELGNHSYSHPNMELLGNAETKTEIVKTNEIIEAITEKKVTWFSPPRGSYREETIQIAHSLNQRTVMWTVDTIDWNNPSPEELKQRVLSKVHPGAMILMHPTDASSKALGDLIIELKTKNLRIGTVSRLLDEERIVKLQNNKHKRLKNEQ